MCASFLEFNVSSKLTYWMIESRLIRAGIIRSLNFSPRLHFTLFSRRRRPPAVMPNTSTYTEFLSEIIRSGAQRVLRKYSIIPRCCSSGDMIRTVIRFLAHMSYYSCTRFFQ